MNRRLDSSSKGKVSARSGAIVELNRFDDIISLTESSFKPLCLGVGAIHSLEPCSSLKYCPGVKTLILLRKCSRHADTVRVRESYEEVKALIRTAQKEGFACVADLAPECAVAESK